MIAVVALCVSLFILLCALIRVLNRFLEHGENEDHRCISSFVRYKTDDGENIEFESYKLIQVKCSIMQFFDIGFKWSGKKLPRIESDLQIVEATKESGSKNDYDTCKLKLKKPKLYNETTVIHFRSYSNDAERVSEPKIELCVKYPIEFIQVNVI